MTGATAMTWVQSPWSLAVVVPVGAIIGRLLAAAVDRLLGTGRTEAVYRFPAVAAVAAAALWWWEIGGLHQLPDAVDRVDPFAIGLRYVAHLALFALLAAAAWVDLRERVIPDAITVPGVLCGLAWNSLFPATLPPVGHAVTRSFAPPTIVPDVLAAAGPLEHVGLPTWATGVAGLAGALVLFAVWCRFGLPPAAETGLGDALIGRLRPVIVSFGAAGIVSTWAVGGASWAGLATSLVGMAVAGGMVWMMRAGASRALGREAMGFGDVTLMAMAGAWLGWQPCLLACVLAVFIGLVHGVTHLVARSESELPFGPSLCLGLALVVVCWRPIWDAASPQFQHPLEMAVVVVLVITMTAATLWAWSRLRQGGGA